MKKVKKLDEKAILSRLSNGALSNILGGVGLNDKFQQPIDECLAGWNHWGQVHRPWSHRDRYVGSLVYRESVVLK